MVKVIGRGRWGADDVTGRGKWEMMQWSDGNGVGETREIHGSGGGGMVVAAETRTRERRDRRGRGYGSPDLNHEFIELDIFFRV